MALIEADISMSLDGFVTGPDLKNHPGLGRNGEAPLLLGGGTALFAGAGPGPALEWLETVDTPGATHVTYRVS